MLMISAASWILTGLGLEEAEAQTELFESFEDRLP